jgi:hypothetical protein
LTSVPLLSDRIVLDSVGLAAIIAPFLQQETRFGEFC